MAVNRPTFSETWYRVAELRPRLRTAVQTYRQHFRGKTYHVIQDPSNNQYFRLDDAGYFFVGLLDGRRTVAQVWDICNDKLGDRSPTQGEVIQLLSQLYASNILQPDMPPDAATLFERQRKRVQREVRGYITNLLFARFPIWDPDRFLEKWIAIGGAPFTWVGFALWCVLIAVAFNHLAGDFDRLWDASNGVIAPGNLPLLYLCFALIKAIHELGHGFSCKKFGLTDHSGGEVHTVGIMLLVLMPVPYVDASSAWALRSKWKRALVGAAGMYVELAVAAVAAIVWSQTNPTSLVNQIAYNLIFIASVSTILFNANPLLRFDGYYIMSDLLEVPNLYQRSKEYVYYLVKKYVYAVRNPTNPARTNDEKPLLFVYCILAFIYRIIISISILLFIAGQLFVIGLLLAIGGVIGWVIVPLVKFVHYLAVGPELWRTRRRAVLWSAGTAAAIIGAIGLVPAPDRGRAEGIVEARTFRPANVQSDGFITHVLASGTPVRADGDPVIQARNVELEKQRDELVAAIGEARARYRKAMNEKQSAVAQSFLSRIAAYNDQLARTQEQLAELALRPAVNGQWVSFDEHKLTGAFARRGTPVGVVATLDDLKIVAVADQYLGPRIESEIGRGGQVEFRLKSRPDVTFIGMIEKTATAGLEDLPSPALGFPAGGSVPVDAQDQTGAKAASRVFKIEIAPATIQRDGVRLLHGQRVVVRFTMNQRRPLLAQWYRSLRQLLLQEFAV